MSARIVKCGEKLNAWFKLRLPHLGKDLKAKEVFLEDGAETAPLFGLGGDIFMTEARYLALLEDRPDIKSEQMYLEMKE